MNSYNYNNLTLLQLKNLKSKEKDNIKKQNIIKAITRIVKNSQLKWSPNKLINSNNSSNSSESNYSDITISTLSSDSSESTNYYKSTNYNNKSKKTSNSSNSSNSSKGKKEIMFTNYDITKYYNKVSSKKDDNDKIFSRMMNFADCVKTKKPKDISHINKPYKENNNKKILGKRKYIN